MLFDLDGTLTNPEAGITNCIRHALYELGHEHDPRDDLRWCIGPPLRGSLSQLPATDDSQRIEDALSLYRERFSDVGLLENEVYEGIPEALKELKAAGVALFVATSKPQIYAIRILQAFGLAPFLHRIVGSELDGTREAKADVIAQVLSEGAVTGRPLMVGDRSHDVIGARENGLDCLGVLYGFGSRDELVEAGAVDLCDTPRELSECCMRLLFSDQ